MFVVDEDIEQALAVAGPFERAVVVGDALIDELPGRRLDNVHRIELGALGIDRIGDQAVVRAVRDARNAEVGVRLGERVAVDQHLLLAARPRHAAEQRMLTARHVARVIGKPTVRRGHRGVVFLDAPLHLGEQALLQRVGVGHHRRGMGVFLFEMGPDCGIEQRGIAHHRLPVRGPQPSVVVNPPDAVVQRHGRDAAGKGTPPPGLHRSGETDGHDFSSRPWSWSWRLRRPVRMPEPCR